MKSTLCLLLIAVIRTLVHGQSVQSFNGVLSFRTVDPIFDVDGESLLTGDAFLGQLYAGSTEAALVAVGFPMPFGSGDRVGRIVAAGLIFVPGVLPGLPASVQVRAWQASDGQSYEAAVAARGHFGASKIARVETGDLYLGGGPSPPGRLVGMGSFALSAGPLPARLALGAPAAQTLTLSILAQPATQWDVYSSPDLTVWEKVQTFSIDGTGEAKLQLPLEGSQPTFYRAVLGP